MNTIDEAIEVLEGIKEGKSVQVEVHDNFWEDRDTDEMPDFYNLEYRIKPEPREFHITLNSNGSICACYPWGDRSSILGKYDIKVIEVIE